MPERTYRRGEVRCTERVLNIAEWGPDFRGLAELTLRALNATELGDGHCYLNPSWTVEASRSVPHEVFLRPARQACVRWMQQISRAIGSRATRRLVRQADDATRRVLFGGMLFLDGRPAHPKRLHCKRG